MNYSSLNELAIANVRALLGARRESIEVLSTATSIPPVDDQAPALRQIAVHLGRDRTDRQAL